MKKNYLFASIFAVLLFLASCKKQDENFAYYYYSPDESSLLSQYLNLPSQPVDYSQNIPSHLRIAGVVPREINQSKATLGRVLFYDKKLSKDGKISCASCHQQQYGFGDHTAVSKGVYDRDGERNSIPLGSVTSFGSTYGDQTLSRVGFFWDNRARSAEEQAQGSMENEKEMAMTMPEIAAVVSQQPYYEPLFKKAFPEGYTMDSRHVLEAVAAFVNAMGSFNSRFDQAAAQQGMQFNLSHSLQGFTAQEEKGKEIYRVSCASCHSESLSVPTLSSANNGLDRISTDRGVGKITNSAKDEGTFKIPVLRNVALTAPYMHDGRFATLEQVVDHYSSGIQAHQNLHTFLRDAQGQPKRFNFSADEKKALIAFLKTLTDEELKTDKRFSDPFLQ
jgi:cytochrome c peroxidase